MHTLRSQNSSNSDLVAWNYVVRLAQNVFLIKSRIVWGDFQCETSSTTRHRSCYLRRRSIVSYLFR